MESFVSSSNIYGQFSNKQQFIGTWREAKHEIEEEDTARLPKQELHFEF